MDPGLLTDYGVLSHIAHEKAIDNITMPVADQSHHNVYTANNGATVNNNYGSTFYLHASAPGFKPELPPLLCCPAPSRYYTPRKRIEDHMTSYFFREQSNRKQYVLHGLGASGKTQVGLRFVDMHFYAPPSGQKRFSQVFWIDARNTTTIDESLTNIAQAVGAGTSASDVLRWLACRDGDDTNWFIFFDNADDPNLDLDQYFPRCQYGSILVTSRDYLATRYGLGQEFDYNVSEMEPGEVQQLLMEHTRSFSPTAQDLQSLVQGLDRFPLSITQAVTFMSTKLCAPHEYVDMLRSRSCRGYPLQEHGQMKNPDGYQYGSVYAALKTSYNKLGYLSSQLLQLISFLHFAAIKEEIFENMCSGLSAYEKEDERLRTGGENELIVKLKEFRREITTNGRWDFVKFRALVKELQSHSFISVKFSGEQATYSIHPFIQEWVRYIIGTTGGAILGGCRIVAVLLASSTILNRRSWKEQVSLRELAPHVDQVLKLTDTLYNACRNQFGTVYWYSGRWNDARALQELYMEACKTMLGTKHPITLISMNNLGLTYRSQGWYDKAAELHSRVLEMQKEQLGYDNPDTLWSMTQLGNTYQKQGRFDKVIEIHFQALNIRKNRLPFDHRDVLLSMSNLGNAYYSRRQYDKAVELHSQVLETQKQQLEPSHPDTLASMTNLANAQQGQGQYDKAVNLHLQALEIREAQLGCHHPDTLLSMHNLGSAYYEQERYNKAVELLHRAQRIRQQRLGSTHPDTLASMTNLGCAYFGEGRYDKAAEVHFKVLKVYEELLGANHPETQSCKEDLERALQAQRISSIPDTHIPSLRSSPSA